MKKILVGYIMDGRAGGIDKYLLNFLEVNRQEAVQMDFLSNGVDPNLEKLLAQYGSKLYAVPSLRHPIAQYRRTCEIIEAGGYDMAYFNISTAIDGIGAFAARHMKVKQINIHSHSSGNDCESWGQRTVYNLIHNICKLFLHRAATEYSGCSNKAGYWLFPKRVVESNQFEVIYNAVDREKFCYQPAVREEVREELQVQDKWVIGHIGNFCYQKNYAYMIHVFAEVLKSQKDSVLVAVGRGVQYEAIQAEVKRLGIEEQVRFLGWRKDTERLYQAMDVFLMPSRFEGLPVAGVEAQACQLPCVFSDTITRETQIHKECLFLDIKKNPERWVDDIVKLRTVDRNTVAFTEEAKNYDLEQQSQQLRRLACH